MVSFCIWGIHVSHTYVIFNSDSTHVISTVYVHVGTQKEVKQNALESPLKQDLITA